MRVARHDGNDTLANKSKALLVVDQQGFLYGRLENYTKP